ncbi:DUF4262 domain-containing protein [Mesorhizobium sp. STM 4661]|uniref:DUF4262 domain-containing protein n=1 Tax=Mesorhizobium sp. STM 4661 TaxID=1297570 RepID=UPI0002BFA4BC|nr:DUF4262 domain-containing protein [Mesorhizobium sp. STM 4661]CCV16367.1 conserved hypothetical protein [Mesorhizobium sp. STM 4661]
MSKPSANTCSRLFGNGPDAGFTYTVGNADRGLPELLLIGDFPSNIAASLLNELGAKMREDGKPLPAGLVDIGWSIRVKIRRAGSRARSHYTVQVGEYLGHDLYTVLQVMVCDQIGRYPGDASCDPRFDVDRP